MLSRAERSELQQRLASRGFDPGSADGTMGQKTRIAVREFQVSVGMLPDGHPTGDVLDRLRN